MSESPLAVVKRRLRLLFYYSSSLLPIAHRRRLIYFRAYRRLPDLRNPVTFSEKINWRIVNDRREMLKFTCDKQQMKRYVHSLAVDVKVPRTIWAGTDLRDAPSVRSDARWILKPNHSSGRVLVGQGPISDKVIAEVDPRVWLSDFNSRVLGEWAYSFADRQFLLEELIGDGRTDLPDYKFYVFDGVVKLVHVDTERATRPKRRMYTRDWSPLPYHNSVPLGPVERAPDNLARMIEIAEHIGQGFDFIRVDLYDHSSGIWFGEVTPYPAGGAKPYTPSVFDVDLGSCWVLPKL